MLGLTCRQAISALLVLVLTCPTVSCCSTRKVAPNWNRQPVCCLSSHPHSQVGAELALGPVGISAPRVPVGCESIKVLGSNTNTELPGHLPKQPPTHQAKRGVRISLRNPRGQKLKFLGGEQLDHQPTRILGRDRGCQILAEPGARDMPARVQQ